MNDYMSDLLYNKLTMLFYELSGIKLKDYKKYLMVNRLLKFIGEKSVYSTFQELYEGLLDKHNKELRKNFIDALTTNFSFFFRDKIHFDFLSYYLGKNIESQPFIRIWSAASSSGEEAYSMSITAEDIFRQHNIINPDFKILATDISTKMLETAERGEYNKTKILPHITETQKRLYFSDNDSNLVAKDVIRKNIKFRYLNLMEPYPFDKKFDIVFLRNVLIYFENKEKSEIMNKIFQYIKKDGYLILGLSESTVGIDHKYKALKYSIFKKTIEKE